MSDPTGPLPRSDGGFVIEHSTVDGLVKRLVDTAESLSAGFDLARAPVADRREAGVLRGKSIYRTIPHSA